MDDDAYLRRAIDACRLGIAAGQSPFGALIVRNGAIIAEAHNTVLSDLDPTAHAEVNAIRAASASLKTINLHGCTLYSTCEPCPMCLAASHWAKIDRLVFGARISDATAAGFSELAVPAATLAELGRSPLRVEQGRLHDACADLFREWKETGHAQSY